MCISFFFALETLKWKFLRKNFFDLRSQIWDLKNSNNNNNILETEDTFFISTFSVSFRCVAGLLLFFFCCVMWLCKVNILGNYVCWAIGRQWYFFLLLLKNWIFFFIIINQKNLIFIWFLLSFFFKVSYIIKLQHIFYVSIFSI